MVVGDETSGSIATPSQANGSAHEREGTTQLEGSNAPSLINRSRTISPRRFLYRLLVRDLVCRYQLVQERPTMFELRSMATSVVMLTGFAIIAVPTGIVTAELEPEMAITRDSGSSCEECGSQRYEAAAG